jgi:glucokinase
MSDPDLRLLADIGGTNARFALQAQGAAPAQVNVTRCADFASLEDAVESYLGKVRPDALPKRAAFAVASPIAGDQVAMTNHPWRFSVSGARARLRLQELRVINDFAAIALAVPALGPGDLRRIGGGRAVAGAPIAVIGPGTGLGVSILVPGPGGPIALATEGGHATLAVADDREAQVVAWLRERFDHASAERALSGPGLVNLYAALMELDGRAAPLPAPDEVTARAVDGSDALAAEAVAMFCAMLGTVAGNLALTVGARGGIFIAGGIVPALGTAFALSPFRSRFEDKGRFRSYVAAIPTAVITRDVPAFAGLAALLDGTGTTISG